MSKVVKKIGRGIGKVFKGVKKVVSKVWKEVKRSPILKTLAVAAAVYLTGGAALGAIGASGGGIGAMVSGAGQGIASAWSGMSGAVTSLAGGNFAAAGNSLTSGLSGASAAGAKLGADAAALASASATPSATGLASLQGGGSMTGANLGALQGGGAMNGVNMAALQGGGAMNGVNMAALNGGVAGGAAGGVLSSGLTTKEAALANMDFGTANLGNVYTAAPQGATALEAGMASGVDAIGAGAAESGGILGFIKANPMASALMAQPVIGGVQGYAQAKQAEEDEKRRIQRLNDSHGLIDYNKVYTPHLYNQEQPA